ncbi:MAG: hypothetical protein PHO20_03425 [Candidatus Peribacteraceae bacterium]|nr:hypothetical protein [Candidatus Peribacteraceae bacterium]MDD5739793.1 hypothetical protein [Candidatus Peribacteraceae bacterium]
MDTNERSVDPEKDKGSPGNDRHPDDSAQLLANEAHRLTQLAYGYSVLEQGGRLPAGIRKGTFAAIVALVKEAKKQLDAVSPHDRTGT